MYVTYFPGEPAQYNQDRYLQELIHQVGRHREWSYDPRIREPDYTYGYFFRPSNEGAERIPHPRLEVSFPYSKGLYLEPLFSQEAYAKPAKSYNI